MEINHNIQSQYQAALEMLRRVVVQCPDEMWDDPTYRNVFWRVVYHSLFYTHLYLQPRGEDFIAWAKHRPEYHQMQSGGEPYTKAEILEYFDLIRQQIDQLVPASDLEAPSGFGWLPFNRLETHLYNLRHLQQHTGELSERLGVVASIDVDWVTKV